MTRSFTYLGHQDLSGILRGRSVPQERAALALEGGLPWVPANYSIGALSTLPPDNPFGPVGEIRLLPDPATRLPLPADDTRPAFDLYLCDGRQMDLSPWAYCPRTALKDAIAALQAETGLTLMVAFEHEFNVRGLVRDGHVAFSLSAGRSVAPLADRVLSVLDGAGIALEQFQAEYGEDQFEIAGTPADPLTAADRTILTLEAIRDTAHGMGLSASFLPKPAMDAPGNGVHVHISLWRGDRPVTATHDWLTPEAGAFTAGILEGAKDLLPYTVLSANSYARIRPHSWVGVHTCIGLRNREAMLRLVPRRAAADGMHPGATIEYRVTDATANVYIALAAIIRAGLDGLRAGASAPPNVDRDPTTYAPHEAAGLNLRALPQDIDSALTETCAVQGARWLGAPLAGAYLACRRNDARHAQELSFSALADRLRQAY
jgi:glutamine synthetase